MGEQKKKKPGRRAYLNDFHPTAGGDYVYTGPMLPWPPAGQGTRNQVLLRLWALALVGALATVAGGCLPGVEMDGRPYVLLPYMAGLVLAGCSLWSLARLTGGGEELRAYVYQATVERLPGLTLAWAILSALTLVGELVNLALPGFPGQAPMAGLFAALEGVTILVALVFRRIICRTRK